MPTGTGTGNGFDNPSAYCPDLLKMISHIRDRMAAMKRDSPARDIPYLCREQGRISRRWRPVSAT